MRIGSFFLLLLVILIVVGYLLSETIHLYESVSSQQKEIERLTLALQQAELKKTDVIAELETAGRDLHACQLQIQLSNQSIMQLAAENSMLKEQNQMFINQITSNSSKSLPNSSPQLFQAADFSLVGFAVLGIGSIIMMGLSNYYRRVSVRPDSQKSEHIGRKGDKQI